MKGSCKSSQLMFSPDKINDYFLSATNEVISRIEVVSESPTRQVRSSEFCMHIETASESEVMNQLMLRKILKFFSRSFIQN